MPFVFGHIRMSSPCITTSKVLANSYYLSAGPAQAGPFPAHILFQQLVIPRRECDEESADPRRPAGSSLSRVA